ncbi:hypothetical protein C8046_11685 [Serinibacter arcticus]|uniref:Fibronectin type-III domain-containing protein n=1 Tax=Serinibacter arcticus TaxID=1655435 RepID=A0A2U1ZW71_9MICO|nr:hypothetical protein [Serinibacter arcticus]PWD51214.1 hypothetical protein C8046_11685 [Serinibacter arcticus]
MTAENALLTWLEENRNRVGVSLKASQLRLLARAKTYSPAEIETKLPGPAKQFAAELASVLRPFSETTEAGDAAPEPQPSTPSTPAVPPPPAAAAFSERPAAAAEAAEEYSFGTYFPRTLATDLPEAEVLQAEGLLKLAWRDRSEHDVVRYRIVSSHAGPPYHPDRADPVAVTRTPTVVDQAPFLRAVRFYTVWAYEGRTLEEALESSPRQVARATAVAQVAVELKQTSHGAVIAKWTAPEGVEEVRLYRMLPHEAPYAGTDLQYRIQDSDTLLRGFVDREVEPGRTYVYRLVAVARDQHGNLLRSEPEELTIEVPAQLRAIDDLGARFRDLETGVRVVDLSWSTPGNGEVRLYMTDREPDARALDGEWEDRPELLTQMGLSPDAVQAYPFGPTESGLTEMRGVDWRPGSTRLYFTPTVSLNGMLRVGRSRSLVNSLPPTGAELTERVSRQVVRFEWPPGAASVSFTQGPVGGIPPNPAAGAAYEVSAAQYAEQGGFTFPQRLAPRGCQVYLWGVAHDAGQQFPSTVVRLQYPGLAVAHYRLALRRAAVWKPGSVTVTVWTEDEVLPPARFLLVHNPDRLPLFDHDSGPNGSSIPVRLAVEDGAAPQPMLETRAPIRRDDQPTAWVGEIGKRTGWFRLFASTPPNHPPLALLDPPASQLRLA